MRKPIIALVIISALIAPSMALSDYQRGVLDGLNRGWLMAKMQDQALSGDPTAYNQAALQYNAWIAGIFGQNESLQLKPIARTTPALFSYRRTSQPVHAIDASWNQTQFAPQPDAYGLIHGRPAEIYDSWGPALDYL